MCLQPFSFRLAPVLGVREGLAVHTAGPIRPGSADQDGLPGLGYDGRPTELAVDAVPAGPGGGLLAVDQVGGVRGGWVPQSR